MKRTLAGVLYGILASGCAVGYGIGTTSHSASASSSPRAGFPEDGEIKFSAVYQELRIIDTTGLLLAGFVNSGRQYTARQDAIAASAYKAPDANGVVTVEYSYEAMPILAGLLTDLRIRVPLSADLEMPTGTASPRDVEYWAFDLRPEFMTFRPIKSLPLVSSLWFNVTAELWKAPDAIVDADLTELDLGFGTSTSYVIRENITATGRLGIGLLSPIFGAIDGGSKLNPSLEVEVGYRPFATKKFGVQLSAVASIARAHATERSVFADRFGLNAAITFGNQNRAKPRTTETPAPPPATTALSGTICVGGDVPAACNVIDRLGEGEKTVYAICAQATVQAANSADFSTQPNVCRQAAEALAKVAKDSTTLTPAQRRDVNIAAATAYDFAGAGYELTTGRLGADHCAMIEGVYAMVLGADPAQPALPTKVQVANAAVSQCRAPR